MEDRKKDVDIKTIFDFLRITPLVSIGLGFVATSLYFAYIGYFPQNDINSLISILIYVTITSFIVLGFIPFLLYFAVILWIRSTFADPKVSQWLLKPDEIEAACLISFTQKTNDASQTKTITHKILRYYSLSVATPIVIILIAQIFFPFSILSAVAIGLTIPLIGGSFIIPPEFVWNNAIKNQESIKQYLSDLTHSKTKWQKAIFLAKYSVNTLASSFVLLLTIILLLALLPEHDIIYAAFASMIAIVFSTTWFGYVMESDNQPKAHFTLFVLSTLFILTITQGKIIESTLSHSKLGAFDASIFVDYDTCYMFKKLGKEDVHCEKKRLTQVDNLNIKWRGADQYVTFNTKAKDGTIIQHYLIIPSSEIHGEGN